MTAAELRRLAEQLPQGAALTLDRATLLELTAGLVLETTFTVATLAAHLHRSASTVRGWLQLGRFPGAYQLPGTKRAGAWRIPPAAVEAFTTGQRPESSHQDAPGRAIAQRKASRSRRAPDGGGLGAWRGARQGVSSPRTPT